MLRTLWYNYGPALTNDQLTYLLDGGWAVSYFISTAALTNPTTMAATASAMATLGNFGIPVFAEVELIGYYQAWSESDPASAYEAVFGPSLNVLEALPSWFKGYAWEGFTQNAVSWLVNRSSPSRWFVQYWGLSPTTLSYVNTRLGMVNEVVFEMYSYANVRTQMAWDHTILIPNIWNYITANYPSIVTGAVTCVCNTPSGDYATCPYQWWNPNGVFTTPPPLIPYATQKTVASAVLQGLARKVGLFDTLDVLLWDFSDYNNFDSLAFFLGLDVYKTPSPASTGVLFGSQVH